ncbi:vacuolar import and degradation protein-domain-containing protein [Xylariaceae sp. FL0255]|nr:vacuolar import and degradation protein-domain-containing protein [Xylariaceae sp. FL0255]
MPTPSSNNSPPSPPPDLLQTRQHSSSCPEDLRSPNTMSWRSTEQQEDINSSGGNNVDTPDTTTSSVTEEITTQTTDEDMIEESSSSPTRTASPHPEPSSSRIGDAEESTDDTLPAHKPTDECDTAMTEEPSSTPSPSSSSAIAQRPQQHIQHKKKLRFDLGHGVTADSEKEDDDDLRVSIDHNEYKPSMGYEYSNIRIAPTSSSSFLRPGSKFHGTQQSERQQYEVQVEIKYVDMRESFLCGYLKIKGLTEHNPTLTTYFEGEIIGSRYGFLTKHQGWGATEKEDLSHWLKFAPFRTQYGKQVRSGGNPKGLSILSIPNFSQRDTLFMRWKEHFLVPDHRVTDINGASFEGFYYICFNQREGKVSGIYFHAKSEKFQQLELTHVEDRGCFSAIEFR